MAKADTTDTKLDAIYRMMEQLVAIQLYSGGAKQSEIASNLGMSVGKVNSLVKGLKRRAE